MIFKTGTSNFTVRSEGVICDILMIGGGGAGGGTGGGGAGACIIAIGHTLPVGNYNVTIGSGGIGPRTSGFIVDATGRDSSISVSGTILYRAKGGGCGAMANNNGNPGGCGGGGGGGFGSTRSGGKDVSTNIVNRMTNISPTIQPTYAVFGNKGGDQLDRTTNNSTDSCPGGGGIGAAAPNHANGDMAGGPGGAGLNQATINGIPYNFKSYFANNHTFGDISGYIGGGGSGMASLNTTQALGGVGGGGRGTANLWGPIIVATPGAANTGSGGGGGEQNGGNGSGGSGIVIIRYRS
jgi:hypothetical protein